MLPGIRRRAGGRRVYGSDQIERLRFIQRLKTLGLSLAEIGELNAVYAIEGSTTRMLGRLDQLLDGHLSELQTRIAALGDLREQIAGYRSHIAGRIGCEVLGDD